MMNLKKMICIVLTLVFLSFAAPVYAATNTGNGLGVSCSEAERKLGQFYWDIEEYEDKCTDERGVDASCMARVAVLRAIWRHLFRLYKQACL